MAWMFVLGAAALELVWAAALKQSEGFSRLWPSVVGIAAAAGSFVLLTVALRSLPVGTAYAVWVGIGAAGVAILGMLAFGEPVTLARVSFLVLIVIGVVGLRIVEG